MARIFIASPSIGCAFDWSACVPGTAQRERVARLEALTETNGQEVPGAVISVKSADVL